MIKLVSLFLLLFSITANADLQKGLEHFQHKNYTMALNEFTIEANKGNADAMYNIALMYSQGLGVQKNDATMVKYLTMAAEKGSSTAQNALGTFCVNATFGFSRNYSKAYDYFSLAANSKNPDATFHLAEMYANGWLVKKDITMAAALTAISSGLRPFDVPLSNKSSARQTEVYLENEKVGIYNTDVLEKLKTEMLTRKVSLTDFIKAYYARKT